MVISLIETGRWYTREGGSTDGANQKPSSGIEPQSERGVSLCRKSELECGIQEVR